MSVKDLIRLWYKHIYIHQIVHRITVELWEHWEGGQPIPIGKKEKIHS